MAKNWTPPLSLWRVETAEIYWVAAASEAEVWRVLIDTEDDSWEDERADGVKPVRLGPSERLALRYDEGSLEHAQEEAISLGDGAKMLAEWVVRHGAARDHALRIEATVAQWLTTVDGPVVFSATTY